MRIFLIKLPPGFLELIETLWNVNDHSFIYNDSVVGELIETLWNVNICKGLGIHLQDIRINRNIVECK